MAQAPGVVHINVQDPSSASPDELNRRSPGDERLFNPTAYGNSKRRKTKKKNTKKNRHGESVGLRTDAIACGVFSKCVRLDIDVYYSTTVQLSAGLVHQWTDAAGRVWEMRHISMRLKRNTKNNPRE